MSLSDYKFALAVVSIVFIAGSVRTWDLGVVTSAQIQFFKNKEIETLAADRLKDMTAIAYDPIKKDVYVSDANQKVGSIFRMKTTGDAAYTAVEPIVAKQSATVQGMAFDYRTSILYWTTGNGLSINYVHVPENVTKVPLTGVVLFKFKDVIPQGIAIDTCRGYLYWTNCNHLNATIERSRPDGSEHTVLIHEQLFQPLGIAVDMENDLLYWSNEREGMYYSIEASNLDGGTRRTLIHGTHHQPFSIALDERDIYWSDWVNDVVWTMPKDSFQGGVQPTAVVKYESIKTPMGLITSTPAIVNDTQCIAVTRTQNNTWLMTEATLQETVSYEALRNYCKNNGILHANGTCTCALGFEGNFCTTHVCQDYCVSGTCTVDSMGRPQCHCPADFTGERCELQMCTDRCQNGGQCLLDKDGHNRCDCPIGYTGNMCENKLSDFINELCSVYCQPSNPLMKTASAVCRYIINQ
ncbi:Hypothetical protein CINCED_3A018444 [Cinara cedri]|uniref:Protein cueball n=1 Tax=Cinara cedri TaxID=506608 RepID=A0A5E4NEA6_9HEMI|nr:Hypothetical protein CINCED_3A018444 [Cinara cedri]